MKRNHAYTKAKKVFLEANPRCAVFPRLESCDVHHIRGKLNSLKMDQRFWLAVSRKGHAWIDSNREAARAKGWLCKRGEWNNTPEEIAARKLREFV